MTAAAPAGRAGFVPGADRSRPPAPGDLALPVAGRKLLTGPDGRFHRIDALPAGLDWVPLGTLDGTPAWAADAADTTAADTGAADIGAADTGTLPGRWRGWRDIATELPEPMATLAGRALAVITWRRTSAGAGRAGPNWPTCRVRPPGAAPAAT